jgi:hypothetical protein
MQLEVLKSKSNYRFQPLPHQALFLVTGENVVAEVATLERAPDDISDVEDADEAIVGMLKNKKCCVFMRRHSF